MLIGVELLGKLVFIETISEFEFGTVPPLMSNIMLV